MQLLHSFNLETVDVLDVKALVNRSDKSFVVVLEYVLDSAVWDVKAESFRATWQPPCLTFLRCMVRVLLDATLKKRDSNKSVNRHCVRQFRRST